MSTNDFPTGQAPGSVIASGTPGTPVGVLVSLVICVCSWLFWGAMGYSQWAIDSGLSGNMKYDGSFVLNCYLQASALISLAICAYTTWPRSAGGFLVCSVAGFGLATLYTAFFGVAANSFQTMFCAASGVYIGIVFEFLTGACRRLVAHMEATSKAHHEHVGIEPVPLADNIEGVANAIRREKERKRT